MNIAIITARGGSKRIPHKNIKDFCGKPIIAYSIEAALLSGVFDDVMVSTDDPYIADLAKKYGATVPFLRSEETSNDFATTAEVIDEVLTVYSDMGINYSYACCIYPTAPFITSGKLKIAMNMLINNNADSVIPVVKFSFPPQRGMVIDNDKLRPNQPEYLNMRSQDLEPIYHDCGQFYCINVNNFRNTKKLVSANTLPLIMSDLEVQDIDTMEDWTIAEMKYSIYIQSLINNASN